MGENHPHGPSIEHSLHQSIAALMRHAHKRRDPGQQSRRAELTRVVDREGRMLEVDEQGVKPGLLSDLHHRH